MLTLTMRHSKRDRLESLWGALSAAWGTVTSGKGWQAEKRAHGVGGYLRVVEATEGSNGWHVHVHALLFLTGEPDESALYAWKSSIFARWDRALQRRGLRPASLLAQDLHLVRDGDQALADYFTKTVDRGGVTSAMDAAPVDLGPRGGRSLATEARGPSDGDRTLDAARAVALEFTRSAGKFSRAFVGGRTPWGILDAAIATGDADELDLWHEWEAASRGKRQMTWSRGLRQLLDLDAERDDEEIAADELGDASDDRIELTADAWRLVCRSPGLAPLLLAVLEEHGPSAAFDLLRDAGVPAEWSDSG